MQGLERATAKPPAEIAVARLLIERVLRRNGGNLSTPDLARQLRESLLEAAGDIEIHDLDTALVTPFGDDMKTVGKFTFDRKSRLFTNNREGGSIHFPKIQARIFGEIFYAAPGIAHYEDIIATCGDHHDPVWVKTNVFFLRRKLSTLSPDADIKNISSVGYRFLDLSQNARQS